MNRPSERRFAERRVTFLKLFFDLVFVVIISQLAHRLAEHPSSAGVGWFVFLFYAVWSSWINGTLYHDLHATNDVSGRVFTFAQMLAVAMMAAFVGDVPGGGSRCGAPSRSSIARSYWSCSAASSSAWVSA